MIAFGRRMVDNFGWRFLLLLACVYCGVKGLVYRIAHAAFLPYFRFKLGVDNATRFQSLFTVFLLPWSLKPFLGMLSDVLPIGGYHKRWYILASVAVGVLACALLAAAPVGKVAGGVLAAVLFFFITVETAASDLLLEGMYSEKMVAVPESGSDMVTTVWSLYQAGTFFSALVVAGVADRDPSNFFWVCLPIAAQLALPVGAGWLGEKRVVGGFRREKISANGRYFFLGSMMGIAAIGLGAASLWASVLMQAVYSIIVGVVLCGMSLWWLPPMHGRAHVYMFLTSALNANIRGALDPFYTGDAKCNPMGPQFGLRFYLSWSAAVGSVAGLAGIAIFQVFLARTWYRRAFWTTTLLQVAAGAMDILIVERVNRRFGISDKAAYLLGDSIVQDVVHMMDAMPQIVLLSKLCPPGMEAVVYSLLAGFANFGEAVASSIGSLAIDRFGIRTPDDGTLCDFDNLSWLIFFCHVFLPVLTVPLTFVLVPAAKMTDDLFAVAGDGSGYELGDVTDGGEGGVSWGGDPAEPDTWVAPDETGDAPPSLPAIDDVA